jgi:O-antigen/teichoic acid export membrane protein
MFLLAVFRSKNYFKVEVNSSIYYSLIIGSTVFLFFIFKFSVFILCIGFLIARVIQLAILSSSYINKFGVSNFLYDQGIQKYLNKNAYSYGFHYIIGILYLTIDSQLIVLYSGNKELALYQSVFNIVLILLSITDLLGNVFLPYLSKAYRFERVDFIEKAHVINKFIFTLGIIMFVGFNLFGESVLYLLFNDKYIEAFNIIYPFSFVMLFRMLCLVYAFGLTISDNQKDRILIVFITLLINVTLNFIIVPKYGFIGAAYVSMLTHSILALLYLIFFNKFFKSNLLKPELVLFFIPFSIIITFSVFYSSIWLSVLTFLLLIIFVLFVYPKKEVNKLLKMLS